MTNEEAVKQIKENCYFASISEKTKQALDKAIKALEAHPKTDTWSIKDIADTLAKHGLIVEQQPCEDCISREEVQDLISRWLSDYLLDETREALETINCKVGDMPPVTPERPKGKWIWDLRMGLHKCSVCSKFCDFDYLYCPNCGSYNGGGEDEG